jgi:ABC-2 type transport system ATP-binding protein
MIVVQELRKRYGPLVAVDGISFELRAGQTLGLLGPNGAGKTTTLHLMVGLLRPDAGRIEIAGSGDPTCPEVRRHLGIAPQALSLYEELTAAENLGFFGRLYGLRGRLLGERIMLALEQAQLADRAHHRVKTYSGGMKRRLHLACAMIHEPRILFLDEPTVGIDPQARHHILDDIERLKREGRTILLTTHYIEEAERLCDRVAIMDHGRFLEMDTVAGLLERHGGQAVVRAELAPPCSGASRLPGRLDGSTLVIETDRPLEAVGELVASGVAIRTLAVERASLETVFLKLTGRRLRD